MLDFNIRGENLEVTPAIREYVEKKVQKLDGSDEDRENVSSGKTLGKASLTEMETDLVAVDGLKSSVLLKLQELSLSVEPRPVSA